MSTPGPWVIDEESADVTMVYAQLSEGTVPIATVHGSLANARLIAEAPAMHLLLLALRVAGSELHWTLTKCLDDVLASVEDEP